MTLGELRDELRPIARGQAGYDFLERRAAFSILNATDRSDMSQRVQVSRDWHEMLKRDSPLRAQVNEIKEREQARGFLHIERRRRKNAIVVAEWSVSVRLDRENCAECDVSWRG